MVTKEEFGKRLTKLLEKRLGNNFNKADIGRKVNANRSAVTRWTKGEAFPETLTLLSLCEEYGLSADQLFGLSPLPPEPPPPPEENPVDIARRLASSVEAMEQRIKNLEGCNTQLRAELDEARTLVEVT